MAVDPFKPNEALTAIHLNQIVNAINGGLPISGGYGIEATTSTNGGSTIAIQNDPKLFFSPMVCKIKTTGPDAAADFSDYRYWCEIQYNTITTGTATMRSTLDIDASTEVVGTLADVDAGLPKGRLIPAYNVSEFTAGTHSLAVDTIVLVVAARFDSETVDGVQPQVRYVILAGGGALPTGQYQHQLYGMVSQNQAGFEFAQAHALL